MFDDPLSLPLRLSVSLSVLIFALQAARALATARSEGDRPTRLFFAYGALAVVSSAVASHAPPLRGLLMTIFPAGTALGVAIALSTLASPKLRARFDALGDHDVRALLAYRALFGAFIFALAALGHFPRSFAMTAGLGDLVVGWLAAAAPASLAASAPGRQSRFFRALVHGVGFLDLLQVLGVAVTVVRPWSIAHDHATTVLMLPWVFVPFMFALNLHGLRQVFAAHPADAAAEARRDGSEPARRVRSAAS